MAAGNVASRLLTLAGIGTWFAVGLPVWAELAEGLTQAQAPGTRFWVWLPSYLSFGILFLLDTTGKLNPKIKSGTMLIVLTLLAALCQFAQPQYGIMAILFIITAVVAAHLLPFRQGVGWVLGQTVLVALSSATVFESLFVTITQSLIFFGFQIFSLFSTYATLSEARARKDLARLNAELRATQDLVTESSRMAERLRIARDLHDLIGHHLTALSLNLEVASHVASGKAKEPIAQAQSLAKLLLSDVRDVVSTMQEGDQVDLGKALGKLAEGIPNPTIHLQMPNQLQLDDPNRAHVIVRCVQEVITNSIKHAQADNLWIEVTRCDNYVYIKVRDDGLGNAKIVPGNGLTGMRERLESVGGKLSVRSARGQGFQLSAELPV